MKNIVIAYIVLIAAVIALALFRTGNVSLPLLKPNNSPTAKVSNQEFKLLLAKTPDERIAGLANREKLDKNTGMLFVFDKKDRYSFWMKNMKFPIDIIFIDDNKVADIVENAQPPKKNQHIAELPIYKPRAPVNYALEINAGLVKKHKIKVGDKVELKNIK